MLLHACATSLSCSIIHYIIIWALFNTQDMRANPHTSRECTGPFLLTLLPHPLPTSIRAQRLCSMVYARSLHGRNPSPKVNAQVNRYCNSIVTIFPAKTLWKPWQMTGKTGSQRFMAPEVFSRSSYNEKVRLVNNTRGLKGGWPGG